MKYILKSGILPQGGNDKTYDTEDVEHILNVREAVCVLLRGVAERKLNK